MVSVFLILAFQANDTNFGQAFKVWGEKLEYLARFLWLNWQASAHLTSFFRVKKLKFARFQFFRLASFEQWLLFYW